MTMQECAEVFSYTVYGDAVYPPLRDTNFSDVMGAPIGIMTLNQSRDANGGRPMTSEKVDDEAWKVWKSMESWGCIDRLIRVGKSLAESGERDHRAAQGSLLVGC